MDEDVEYVEEWVDLGYSQQAFVGGGEFIDGGVSGIVERHGNHVVKTPWMGPDNRDAQEDMRREARVYQKLFDRFGFHDRFVKTISFDSRRRTITMEYMSNGTLRNYLQSCNQSIRPAQRHAWIKALAEGLEMLHAIKILHTDFTPRNMLLDDHLELKVADFGCSTVDGLNSDAGTNARFYPTPNEWGLPATREADLFALGSCIYEVLTGAPPYSDVPSDQTLSEIAGFNGPTQHKLFVLESMQSSAQLERREAVGVVVAHHEVALRERLSVAAVQWVTARILQRSESKA